MSKEILIHIGEEEKRVAFLSQGKLDDFIIEVDRYQPILGNIYKGKVESILPSINGAFVNIGQAKNGFLYLTDVVNPLIEEDVTGPKKLLDKIFNRDGSASTDKPSRPPRRKPRAKPGEAATSLKEGQEILVQVVKEPFANKGARLTTHITLAGRFVVYMPFDPHHGISRKIDSGKERQRLKEVLKEFAFAKTGGYIVRTASLSQDKKDLVRDAKFLYGIWSKIKKLGDSKKAPALLYKEYDLIWKIARDYLKGTVSKLTIDSKDEYVRLQKFVTTLIGDDMLKKIHLYEGDKPLFQERQVDRELNKIYEPMVKLKSGAHIVIEQTEGVAVVDVNSGKFKTKASPEEAAFQVNLEAAPVIAQQLRLRDLGGIIVIDFIDMTKDFHKRKVVRALQDALSHDTAKTEVNRISSLGLVEMTRARTGKTIESIMLKKCPYCEGRGRIKID